MSASAARTALRSATSGVILEYRTRASRYRSNLLRHGESWRRFSSQNGTARPIGPVAYFHGPRDLTRRRIRPCGLVGRRAALERRTRLRAARRRLHRFGGRRGAFSGLVARGVQRRDGLYVAPWGQAQPPGAAAARNG